jgi:hypothetical protein
MAEEPRGTVVREREEAPEEYRYREPQPPSQTSALALASLATGIAAWLIFPIFGAIAAVVTGYLAQDEIRRSEGRLTGAAYATAGLVLGWVQIGLLIAGIIVAIVVVGVAL